jgi:hypothetical protein
MSQSSVIQAAPAKRSAPHHERTTGLLLMPSLSTRQPNLNLRSRPGQPDQQLLRGEKVGGTPARRTPRRPDKPRRSREVRPHSRQHGRGSNRYSLHWVLNLPFRFGDQGPGMALQRRPGPSIYLVPHWVICTLAPAARALQPRGRHLSSERSSTPTTETPLQQMRLDQWRPRSGKETAGRCRTSLIKVRGGVSCATGRTGVVLMRCTGWRPRWLGRCSCLGRYPRRNTGPSKPDALTSTNAQPPDRCKNGCSTAPKTRPDLRLKVRVAHHPWRDRNRSDWPTNGHSGGSCRSSPLEGSQRRAGQAAIRCHRRMGCMR